MSSPLSARPSPPRQSTEAMKLDKITDSIVKAFFLALFYRAVKSTYILWANRAMMGIYNVLDIIIFVSISVLTYYTSFWNDILKRE